MADLNKNMVAQIKRNAQIIRFNRFIHTWFGLGVSIIIISLAVTGVMLNHKTTLGYMPDVKHKATGTISENLPMEKVVMIAIQAAGNKDITAVKDIDRVDFRPKSMYSKVRFKDDKTTEVTVDTVTGEVLNVGYRGDVFLSKLHSGELFGANFIIMSDIAAVGLSFLTLSGICFWVYPRWMRNSLKAGG